MVVIRRNTLSSPALTPTAKWADRCSIPEAGWLKLPSRLVLVLLFIALLVIPITGMQSPGTPRTQGQSIKQQLEAEGFFPLSPPLASFEVGGLVLPGGEQLGTRYKNELKLLFGPLELEEKRINLENPLSLGTFDELKGRIPALSAATLSNDNQCLKKPLEAKELIEKRLFTDHRGFKSRIGFRQYVAERAEIKVEELQRYVIVTSIVAPVVKVKECSSIKDQKEIEQALDDLAWGYRAGEQVGGGAAWTVEPARVIDIKLSELQLYAQNLTIWVKPVQSEPAGAKICWINRVKLNHRNPFALTEYDYDCPGHAPLRSLGLNTGAIYFRLSYGDGRCRIQKMDIEVIHEFQPLVLRFDATQDKCLR